MTEAFAVALAPAAIGVAATLAGRSADQRSVILAAATRVVPTALAVADRVVRAALDSTDAFTIATAHILAP